MFRNKISDGIDSAMLELLSEMQNLNADSKEYTAMAENLEVLRRSRNNESKRTLSTDTIVAIAANLAGIALILYFEQANVVTSKALGFVSKIKS